MAIAHLWQNLLAKLLLFALHSRNAGGIVDIGQMNLGQEGRIGVRAL